MSSNVRRVLIVVAIAVFGAGLFAIDRLIGSKEVEHINNRVSKVESPCLKYGPKSKLCQKSFEKALGTLTHPEACAVERKAGTLKAIRELAASLHMSFQEPCAGARLAQERQRGKERAATKAKRATTNGGPVGDARPGASTDRPSTSNAPSVPDQSPTHPHGGGGNPGRPKHREVPGSPSTSPSAPKAAEPSPTPGPEPTPTPVPSPEQSHEEPAPVPPTKSGLEVVGEEVGHVVEGVTNPVTEVPCKLGVLCP